MARFARVATLASDGLSTAALELALDSAILVEAVAGFDANFVTVLGF